MTPQLDFVYQAADRRAGGRSCRNSLAASVTQENSPISNGEVRPLALRLHSEVSANLLECNFNPPAQREPFYDPDRRDRRVGA